jgi:hypothetical protein
MTHKKKRHVQHIPPPHVVLGNIEPRHLVDHVVQLPVPPQGVETLKMIQDEPIVVVAVPKTTWEKIVEWWETF